MVSAPGITSVNNEDEYARTWKDANGELHLQALRNHLERVGDLAASFAKPFGGENLAYAEGVVHDLGKATPEFQTYLFDENAQRGSVRHSIIGAKYLYDKFFDEYLPLAELMANIVAAHHGELYDFIAPDGRELFADKINSQPVWARADFFDPNAETLNSELTRFLHQVPLEEDKAFALSLFTKMLYSCLVDADRLDAYLFESQQTYEEFQAHETPSPEWSTLSTFLEDRIAQFKTDSETAILRQAISQQCAESGLRERGIYKLQAPTGGGKTLSSLRFALAHAKKHNLDRIIYVIPYLSIISQTANSIRDALGGNGEVILEHHSNILPDDYKYYKLHTGRWDKPIILTTQVQFLESIFSARGSDLRKLHSMANSLLIFDEVQSLPVNCIHLFNSTLNFLNKVCGSSILLCTATQPLLDKVDRPVLLSDSPSIAECDTVPKRTKIINSLASAGYTYAELVAFVQDKHRSSTLLVVNTKAAAKSLYNLLAAEGLPVLHLSTNMCPAHRDDVIADLREKLRANEPVICVSTQLIEAGVDISFECVIRDIAGLDSIWQAAGRCNRHGEYDEVKPVYVVNIAGENLSKLKDIRDGAEITQRLFHEGKFDDIDEYYEHYFFSQRRRMDYPIPGGTIYDLLSGNLQGCNAFRNNGNSQRVELPFAIRSAADAFCVIAPGQHEVVVPYGWSEEALSSYWGATDVTAKSKLLQQLGRYCVSMYSFQYNILQEKGALSEQEGITVLTKGFYNEKIGVDADDGKHEFLNV